MSSIILIIIATINDQKIIQAMRKGQLTMKQLGQCRRSNSKDLGTAGKILLDHRKRRNRRPTGDGRDGVFGTIAGCIAGN